MKKQMYLNKTSTNIELILKDLNKKDLDISEEMNSLAIDIFLSSRCRRSGIYVL
jgi:hypothetical protein